MVLVCPGFFGLVFSVLMGLFSGCVDGSGARYWRLNEGFWWSTEKIKNPYDCRGFRGLG
jgi:hypothetical protein